MNDLHAIREYAAVNSAAYADRLVSRLVSRVSIVENFPEARRMVPEFRDPAIRELPERHHRLVYRIRSATRVDVLRVYPAALPLPDALS